MLYKRTNIIWFSVIILFFNTLIMASFLDEIIALGYYDLNDRSRANITDTLGVPKGSRHQYDGSPGVQGFYETAKHHIIPLHQVKKFFNKAFGIPNVDIQNRLKHFIKCLLQLALTRYPEKTKVLKSFDEFIEADAFRYTESDEIMADEYEVVPVWNEEKGAYEPTILDSDMLKTIKAVVHWMPFNWFEGPGKESRNDDPKGDFEINCERIVGTEAFQWLHFIYERMHAFELTQMMEQKIAIVNQIMDTLLKLMNTYPEGYEFSIENYEHVANRCVFVIKKPVTN